MPDIDLVETYLASVRQHDLLTAEQEVALAKIMEKGHRTEGLLEKGAIKLNRRSRREVSRRIRAAQDAKNKFLAANLRLVVSQARKKLNGSGVELLDLIQAGNLGLIRAVEKWDWRRGYRFSTYAVWWIRQAVTREIQNHSRAIRIPVNTWEKVYKYQKIYNNRYEMTGEPPTLEQMSQYMKLPLVDIRRMQDALEDMVKWDEILNEPSPVFDTKPQIDDPDNPITLQETYRLVDYLEDFSSMDQLHLIEESICYKQLHTRFQNLPAREQEILILHFGLNGNKHHTLEQIGSKYGLTRERIRQLEKKALSRLSHPTSGIYYLE